MSLCVSYDIIKQKVSTLKNYDYDAFGVEQNPETLDVNPFRYCGEYTDKETNTLYLRNRSYSAVTGRFTSEDPIRDGLNWYGYCENNPVMFIDPSGYGAIIERREPKDRSNIITGSFSEGGPSQHGGAGRYSTRLIQDDPQVITTTSDINQWANEQYGGEPNIIILVRTINDGSRNSNPILNGGFDPGHAFIRIDDGNGNVQTKGFWAVGLGYAAAATKKDVTGKIKDTDKEWTVAISYQITSDQVGTVNKYIEDFSTIYNIEDSNCLNFAIGAFDSIGLSLPIEKHVWQGVDGFYGYSPSDAVMDIRDSGQNYIQYSRK